ncbi:terminase large subunit domain-containing protein [Candidatus Poriferisocius sp.]|uniref:terminase large subunit domain-containing protein n=1 Tax=Candidatus Poriferisocius sp. TaxID=3101276 RepID=UPI003B012351
MIQWSPKQKRVVEAISQSPETESVVVVGPVQSGKTLSSIHAFLWWATSSYTGEDFLLGARSRKQAQGTILRYATEWSQMMGAGWRRREDYYTMRSTRGGYNRFFVLLGGKSGSEQQARSFAARGALGDEATLLDDEFLNSLADRCSRPNAKFVLVTNPAGPAHPIKTDWVDAADGHTMVHIPFELADNPTLTASYVAGLHRRYHGAMKKRMVFGQWAVSSGAIFPHIAEAIRVLPTDFAPWQYTLGVDWAHSSVTHAVLVAHMGDGTQWAMDEWRYDGQDAGPLSEAEQARRIIRWLGDRRLTRVSVDPHAMSMWQALRERIQAPVIVADNTVAPALQHLRTVTEEHRLLIASRCHHLVKELHNYQWDDRAALRGEDKPLKENDHGVDALRYDQWTGAGPKRAVRVIRSKHHARRLGLV